jgi:metallo-beta-lactamase family protein
MHLLEVANRKILLECGMYRGPREEARQRNSHFPFHPRQLDAVIISHAHIDHCGNLPTLIRQGYAGRVYCTPATRDLLGVILADSARIQEEDAAHINIARNYSEPWAEPLYSSDDAERAVLQCVTFPYDTPKEILPGVEVRFADAGHILGSAMVALRLTVDGREHTVTFTGDLGRTGLPFLRPPAPVPPADVIICESTYGGRTHEPMADTIRKLEETAARTLQRGGKVLVPAFSLGRTQLVVHYLRQAMLAGRVPRFPIYVDSPLAADIAEVYRGYPDALDETASFRPSETPDFVDSDDVRYVRSFEESQRLSTRPGPCVLVAASGMCEAGRILHHLKHNVDDPRNTVILVSFQAPGTVGRRLLEARPTIRFMGKDWNKWTDVVHLDGFSGHADRADFEALLGPLAGRVKRLRLIHGEKEQAEALAATLRGLGFGDVAIPAAGESVPLD